MMFGFKKKKPIFGGGSKNEQMLAAMRDAVEQQKRAVAYEPYILTGKDLADLIIVSVEDEERFGLDTALCIVGAMAGFSAACVAAANFSTMDSKAIQDGDYVRDAGHDGMPLYTGAIVDTALISGRLSFWRILEAKAKAILEQDVPAPAAIRDHVDGTIGSTEFGQPRMPDGVVCVERPAVLVAHLWPEFFETLTARDADPQTWCLSWGFAAQELLERSEGQIPCSDAVRAIMECAVPMSRLDPGFAMETALAA